MIINMNDENSVRFYKTKVAYNCHVFIESEFGRVSAETITVSKGDGCSFEFAPDEGYRLKSITVDGAAQELTEDMTGFSLSDVQTDHKVKVTFEKIPFPVWKALLLAVAAAGLIVVSCLVFLHIRKQRAYKRKRELRRRRREREQRLMEKADREMAQLEELEEIIRRRENNGRK